MDPLSGLVLTLVSLLMVYLVIRLAVRDGILAADEHRRKHAENAAEHDQAARPGERPAG